MLVNTLNSAFPGMGIHARPELGTSPGQPDKRRKNGVESTPFFQRAGCSTNTCLLDEKLHPAIFGATFTSGIAVCRLGLAKALGGQTVGSNALVDKIVVHRL